MVFRGFEFEFSKMQKKFAGTKQLYVEAAPSTAYKNRTQLLSRGGFFQVAVDKPLSKPVAMVAGLVPKMFDTLLLRTEVGDSCRR